MLFIDDMHRSRKIEAVKKKDVNIQKEKKKTKLFYAAALQAELKNEKSTEDGEKQENFHNFVYDRQTINI